MANAWDRTYNPSGAIARTLNSGTPGQSPSQNYADFGSAGMYPGSNNDIWGGNFASMLGTRADTAPFFDDSQARSWAPNQNPNLATQGAGSIRQWGTQNPNMPGSMALDPTWAGGLRGAGMNAETTLGDTIVEGTRPGGIQDWIDEGLIDPGNWKSVAQTTPVVEATNTGDNAGPSCPNGYTYDPQLQACVLERYSNDMSGLSAEQKVTLLQNAQLMYLYQQNKNVASGGSASGGSASGGLLGQVPQTGQDDGTEARRILNKYGGRDEPAESFMNQEELNIVNRWRNRPMPRIE